MLADRVLRGRNVRRVPHDPSPVLTIWAPLAPGDFLDRFAVLTAKRARFDPTQRALIEREYRRFHVIYEQTVWPDGITALFTSLVALHLETFDAFQKTVPEAIDGRPIGQEAHEEAIRLNRRRVELKNEVDALCHGPYTEVKSYYR
jgi:hypothetical protein